jgi:hypothetical protein
MRNTVVVVTVLGIGLMSDSRGTLEAA